LKFSKTFILDLLRCIKDIVGEIQSYGNIKDIIKKLRAAGL